MSESGRSFYARALALIANVYLISFALDGLLSLLDELLGFASAGAILNTPRAIVAGVVILFSLVMLLPIIFAPRLPKHVFLPLIAFALWAGFGAPPLGFSQAGFVLTLIQVALAGYGFFAAHRRGGSWAFNSQSLPPRSAPLLRVGVALLVTVTATPFVVGGLLVVAFAQAIEMQTGNYVDFTTTGIDLRETVLEKDGKTVRLVAMMHVGESRYYSDFYNSVPDSALIIEEGVSDRKGRLAGQFSYQRLARVLGLEQQPRFRSTGSSPEKEEADQSDAKQSSATSSPQALQAADRPIETGPGPDIVNPDADVSDFSDTTIAVLLSAADLYQSDSLLEVFRKLNKFMDETTPEETQQFFRDVVDQRNARVLAALDKNLANYDIVVIPWGALHMPGLQKKILERGFRIKSTRTIPLARYETIFHRTGA